MVSMVINNFRREMITLMRISGPVVICLVMSIQGFARTSRSQAGEEKAANAIRQLWSTNPAEREIAKSELIQLNQKALPALLALLKDIIQHPSVPRFALGREEEGKLLWERFLNSPGDAGEKIADIEITSRLQDDLIEIAGDLRAPEAIPLLIEVMTYRIKTNWIRQPIEPEMLALGKISKPAIPALIRLIEETENQGLPSEAPNPQITQEEWLIFARSSIINKQTKAVIVLGDIGDKQALPLLERLMEKSQDPSSICPDPKYIQAAIKKINVTGKSK